MQDEITWNADSTFAKAIAKRKIDKLIVIDGSNEGPGLQNLSKSLIDTIPGSNESLKSLGLEIPLIKSAEKSIYNSINDTIAVTDAPNIKTPNKK